MATSDKLGMTGTLLVGAALGYAASKLLTSGPLNAYRKEIAKKTEELKSILSDESEQERLKDIFKENAAQARSWYRKTKNKMIQALAELRGTLEDIDKQKYMYAVEDAVQSIKEQQDLSTDEVKRLKNYLSNDFQKLKDAVALS